MVYWSQLSIYLLWMIGILLDQRAFTYHGILIRSLVNHATRACKIANHASRCDVRSRVTRITWVQSRVTLQLLGPLRVTQKPFATLFDVACNFHATIWRMTIKNNVLFRIIVKSAALYDVKFLQHWTSRRAEFLHHWTSWRAEILQRLTAQACKNSARHDVQWCRNSARFDV